ncbi:DUF1758 domain-containing protein, partial [Nephila pilipes]
MIKEILKSKYGNKDKIIQAHLDYLENLTPIKDLSPSALNELYIDCNRRLQALDALGEKTQSYGRIMTPKILRTFPHEICRNWIVYAKRENLAENDITKLMKFLSEEVEGTVTANNIKGSLVPSYPIKSSLENFNVHSRPINLQAFESPTSFSHKRRQAQFKLSSNWDKAKVNVIAFESSNRYASHPSSPTDVSRFAKSKRMKLADPDDSLSSLPIEILIGADFYWNVMHSDAPVKLKLKLWIKRRNPFKRKQHQEREDSKQKLPKIDKYLSQPSANTFGQNISIDSDSNNVVTAVLVEKPTEEDSTIIAVGDTTTADHVNVDDVCMTHI